MSALPPSIRGILFDLDGTLFLGDEAYPGAVQALARLRQQGVKLGFLSNITRLSRRELVGKLLKMGFDAKESELINPAYVGRELLIQEKKSRAMLLVPEPVKEDFSGIEEDSKDPQVVIVGDLGDAFTPDLLNQAFLALMRGAELLALQKNRYWRTVEGFKIDAGGYVSLLEYSANKKARVLGKPEPDFFRVAIQMLALPENQIAMVGDDLLNDVRGAQNVGLFSVLVRTGKFSKGELAKSDISPQLVLDSVSFL